MIKLPHTTSWTAADEMLHDCFDGDEHIALYEVYEEIPDEGLYVTEEKDGREGKGWWIIGPPTEVEEHLDDRNIWRYEMKAELGHPDTRQEAGADG